MRFFAVGAALLSLIGMSAAHLCLLSPTPRGGPVDVNVRDQPACALGEAFNKPGPCGGVSGGAPTSYLAAGQNFTVVFQKNEDHFYAAAPGSFEINLMSPQGKSMNLATIPDTNTTADYIYQVTVQIPDTTGPAILQAVYLTNNPDVKDTNFYQCTDVQLVNSA